MDAQKCLLVIRDGEMTIYGCPQLLPRASAPHTLRYYISFPCIAPDLILAPTVASTILSLITSTLSLLLTATSISFAKTSNSFLFFICESIILRPSSLDFAKSSSLLITSTIDLSNSQIDTFPSLLMLLLVARNDISNRPDSRILISSSVNLDTILFTATSKLLMLFLLVFTIYPLTCRQIHQQTLQFRQLYLNKYRLNMNSILLAYHFLARLKKLFYFL